MIISRKKYNEFHQDILDRTQDLTKANEEIKRLKADHKAVIEERNQVGSLLLDSLALLERITISKRQNDLIVERKGLVERAKAMGYLPGREEESHAQDYPAIHQASSSEG